MNFLKVKFVVILFLNILALVVVALGEATKQKSGDIDYELERIRKYAMMYTAEENEYATSRDGWLQIHRRQQAKTRTREKTCYSPLQIKASQDKALRSPRAKLFTRAEKKGNVEMYDFKSATFTGGCYDLSEYQGAIRSVDSGESCIRLFSDSACRSWSQAVYVGSTNIPDAKIYRVSSIGPCASNEFEYSTLIKSTSSSAPSQLEKLPSALNSFENVPDLISDTQIRSGWTVVSSISNPIFHYLLGPGNRVEAIEGSIFGRHLKSPEYAENVRVAGLEKSFYSQLELEEEDEPGFVIPLELGGPADQIYNVFPQNRKQAGYFKGKIVPFVKQMLTSYPSQFVFFTVNFIYKNPITTRPSGMWYWGSRINNRGYRLEEIFYGYVRNSD